MPKPNKCERFHCAACQFEKQELDESIAYWQQQDEDLNLEVINKHEIENSTEAEATHQFHQELKKRKTND